jgi:hypothetical protein
MTFMLFIIFYPGTTSISPRKEAINREEKMKENSSISLVKDLMGEFADLTGLSSTKKNQERYLWTDAFAVCNFLELYRRTRNEEYKDLALKLIDQVHNVLGRHRQDDPRKGWISGLAELEGKKHPTKGGLRIGKKMNERRPADPYDDRLEWDRDGQYFHYLTKWMHALYQANRVTGDGTYLRWALELAETAHAKFTYTPSFGGQKRMYWKMSIDLSRPLVPSMGQHDPLDGYIIYDELQAMRVKKGGQSSWPDLSQEIAEMTDIMKEKSWVTDDPLGIGGLLSDAYMAAQLTMDKAFHFARPDLAETLLDSALIGLGSYARLDPLNLPADYRLAFRELGLSIGIRAVERLQKLIEGNPNLFPKKQPLESLVKKLMKYGPMAETVERFWLDPDNRETGGWKESRGINIVMLATSLAPDGYLMLE